MRSEHRKSEAAQELTDEILQQVPAEAPAISTA
jgi:hypothetical protein